MNLQELIEALDALDPDKMIYIGEPVTPISPVELFDDPLQLPFQKTRNGLTYFMEVEIARDFLEGWLSNLDRVPSLQEKCERLIQYHENDA